MKACLPTISHAFYNLYVADGFVQNVQGEHFPWQQTLLTHADIGGNTTNIDVRDKLFLYNFLQGCFAQFGIVKKCWVRVNVRKNSLAYDLTTGVDLMCWCTCQSSSHHLPDHSPWGPCVAQPPRTPGRSAGATKSALSLEAPQTQQCRTHCICPPLVSGNSSWIRYIQ